MLLDSDISIYCNEVFSSCQLFEVHKKYVRHGFCHHYQQLEQNKASTERCLETLPSHGGKPEKTSLITITIIRTISTNFTIPQGMLICHPPSLKKIQAIQFTVLPVTNLL